jgi:glycosyltransferase involved in cell wall biosynthesis
MNNNSENFFKWVFRQKDELNSIVFLFISRVNANNARFIPLFQHTQKIRIIYLSGLPIRYTDSFSIKVFKLLQVLFSSKIGRYQSVHFFDVEMSFKNQSQVLHIDDPVYSHNYLQKIKVWELNNHVKGCTSKIITTNAFTSDWLRKNTNLSNIIIIEQGFHDFNLIQKVLTNPFICGYSSPYINYGKDKNSSHPTYGAEVLINEIIPQLYIKDPEIEIHLIGKLGKHARKALEKYPNVLLFGRTKFSVNMKILTNCSIGIYPRKTDNKRSVLKIFTYLGAGLPIVTFDSIDTEIVERLKLGFSVKNSNQFVEKVLELKQSDKVLKHFQRNIRMIREQYSWKSLAIKMENLLKD